MSEIHPCLACGQAPCCQNLPLEVIDPETRADFDDLLTLLDFPAFEIVLKADGSWNVFYQQACQFLDLTTKLCTIHNTDRQPEICQAYSAWTCWYRRAFDPVGDSSLRFDRRRLAWFVDRCVFDLAGRLHRAPDWSTTATVFADWPLRPRPASAPVLAPAGEVHRLAFLRGPLVTATNQDFARFRLGFPGISLSLAQDTAWFEVQTPVAFQPAKSVPKRWQVPDPPITHRFTDPAAFTVYLNSSAGPDPASRPAPSDQGQTP